MQSFGGKNKLVRNPYNANVPLSLLITVVYNIYSATEIEFGALLGVVLRILPRIIGALEYYADGVRTMHIISVIWLTSHTRYLQLNLQNSTKTFSSTVKCSSS
jgi:hypothetical protein